MLGLGGGCVYAAGIGSRGERDQQEASSWPGQAAMGKWTGPAGLGGLCPSCSSRSASQAPWFNRAARLDCGWLPSLPGVWT